ncbi:TMEM175 family protein [Gordonia phosphorivorans]|uniref:TMEM175 family protein n=1 Tax=Gordonia phosphorivorans TaxID=1056982 RepID=A0ABV6H859_9ACTN
MNAPSDRPSHPDPASVYAYDSHEFGRGVTFFDAIYAFSATLLITNLDAPEPAAWRSLQGLSEAGIGTQLFGFALSFVVIAVFWRTNVRMMRNLTGLDRPTTAINLLAAGLVILIPFTTQGISDPATQDYALPTALYALNIMLAALAQIALGWVGQHRGLNRVTPIGRERTAALVNAWLTPTVFAVSIPVTLAFGPAAGQWTWLTVAVAQLPLARYHRRHPAAVAST